MAIYRRGFPEDAQFREMERIELTSMIRAIQLLPFTFVLFCAVITMAMPWWFDVNAPPPPSRIRFPAGCHTRASCNGIRTSGTPSLQRSMAARGVAMAP
ncbi:hypothetical protein RHMOL_Rhmol11G0012900 [Rhododendron molle]|uniref:Uncharacterized protein n=1 Tax=Rhododendron molle TaxID=49168 RepID=A0ACC0LNK3_RHOML|nr:hypothetical protein RHMOL_Rhmol11G0012900 [Rhododendron molle]